jgi:GNAT superfamily N-acetyltransferase
MKATAGKRGRPATRAAQPAEARASNSTLPAAAEAPRDRTVSIRLARAADIAQVIAIDEQVTGLAKADYWQSLFQRYSRPSQTEQFFLVAIAADGASEIVLGFILGEVRAWEFGSAPCGWVFALSVRPDQRLHGVGQVLLDAMAERFRSSGVTKMRTMVARGNQLLMLFFRSGGMVLGPYMELEKELRP